MTNQQPSPSAAETECVHEWDGLVRTSSMPQSPQPSPTPQADSQPAPQGETNVQLDTDSNHSAPGQQRDVAGSVALGQPVGNGSDQAAGHTGAQGDKLLIVAERNIRSFLRSAVFKSESDREAALNCVDVLWEAASAPADSVTAPAGGAAPVDTINLPDGATLKKEQYTSTSPDKLWALYRGKSLIRWLNPFERQFIDAALAAARKQGGA